MKNICVLRGEGERSYGHCVVRLVYIQTKQYYVHTPGHKGVAMQVSRLSTSTQYVQLRTCSIYTTCVLYVLVVDLLMYVGIHTVLLTDCHLEKNQRHTSSAATFVPSKYLLSYSVLPIHHLIQVETTSQFFFISKSQYSIEDLFLGCCCCYSPKKLREETFLFLSRYTQVHSTMAKNSKGGRQVFFVCLFCGFLLPCP